MPKIPSTQNQIRTNFVVEQAEQGDFDTPPAVITPESESFTVDWLKLTAGWSASTPNQITGTPCWSDGTLYENVDDKTVYILTPLGGKPGGVKLLTGDVVAYVPFFIMNQQTGQATPSGVLLPVSRAVMFPVTLTQTGGAGGDETTEASWTYTVDDAISGDELDTAVDPTASPHKFVRHPAGAMTKANTGWAYYNAAGAFVLTWINEVLDTEEC